MLAPIALYDDALLSQVLMAASYPLEIVEAARWSQANPNLKGDAAVNCRRRQELGCQRQIAGGLPFRSEAAQRASRLDPEAGRRADRPAAGRGRLDPAPARQGRRGRHPEDRQGADRHRPRRRAARPSTPFSRPIRRSSTCPATIRTPPMASGPIRAIRRPTIPTGGALAARPDVGRGHCGGGRDVRRLELGLWRTAAAM